MALPRGRDRRGFGHFGTNIQEMVNEIVAMAQPAQRGTVARQAARGDIQAPRPNHDAEAVRRRIEEHHKSVHARIEAHRAEIHKRISDRRAARKPGTTTSQNSSSSSSVKHNVAASKGAKIRTRINKRRKR